MKKIDSVLKEALEIVKPSEEELDFVKKRVKEFSEEVKKEVKKQKIIAEVFVGGSLAKNTLIRKEEHDVDVFLRFDRKYGDKEISKLTEKILRKFKKNKIHGSRDYFRINTSNGFFIEVIPVKKIKNPKDAENITDLSYSHVNYIKKKLKTEKLLDEVRLAKAFCYANGHYGAESYVKGFSGYAIELLIYKYGSFMKFAKAIIGAKEKIIIDLERHYKNKREILMDLNEAKLQSPIIIIDPTYKQRNALAALSDKTFEEFREKCKKFFENPSVEFFVMRTTDLVSEKEKYRKKFDTVHLIAETKKQEGDIAGSKLLKFYNHLETQIEKYFDIKEKKFTYNGGKSAEFLFAVKKKKEIIFEGPFKKDEKNSREFRKKRKSVFEKSGKLYAREKVNFDLADFIKNWKKRHSKRMEEMSVSKIDILD